MRLPTEKQDSRGDLNPYSARRQNLRIQVCNLPNFRSLTSADDLISMGLGSLDCFIDAINGHLQFKGNVRKFLFFIAKRTEVVPQELAILAG